ncbi:histidine phosphatase family protein [Hyphomicrobium methylovorum]|uniref:SixA phosphatase family protein n=1 Tax=Hyphomicrobium methylovorum TaxID=84 RepID=UPI0015E6D1C1|nr:histidine phosphatase family protein [Hyphomicrobium methylovorum]MBA2127687.1 histidine phosphatase family protein [Hyphomicrobium methylovorum]
MLSLALLRHAKSTWDNADLDDFDRPLNDRGRSAAPLMGEVLKSREFTPEVILCSSAKRTRETLDLSNLGKSAANVVYDDQLYLTDTATLLSRLRSVDAENKVVLMIGHNPGLHGLARMLAGTGDAKSISRLEDKFPTAALALFRFPHSSWREIAPATGHLEAFITPRDRVNS